MFVMILAQLKPVLRSDANLNCLFPLLNQHKYCFPCRNGSIQGRSRDRVELEYGRSKSELLNLGMIDSREQTWIIYICEII